MTDAAPLAVVAIGGHALQGAQKDGLYEGPWPASRATAEHLADLAEAGLSLVITHGNGPQVGHVLRRSDIAAAEVPPLSMDLAVAHTQGGIGYVLSRCLSDALGARQLHRPVVGLVSQTLVDADDEAFERPTKPIGSYMTASQAQWMADNRGWHVVQQAQGWRRVVASPLPLRVLELESIRRLAAGGTLVIAAGGGGIPVVCDGPVLRGVPAVVDKDLVSSLLARELKADVFIIASDVDRVALNFGTPAAKWLDRLTVAEAARHLDDGQFPPGSMAPKLIAAIEYLESGGRRAVITSTSRIVAAWHGHAGTEIVMDHPPPDRDG